MLVSVDNPKFSIPNFIKTVPTILTISNDLITGDSVTQYLEKKAQSLLPQSTVEISPFTMGSGYSSQYTWLTEDGYDNEGLIHNSDQTRNNNFILLNTENKIVIEKDNEADSKSNRFDSSMYEKYLNSRANDDENIKRIMDTDGRAMR